MNTVNETFRQNRAIRHSAITTLLLNGVPVREAVKRVKEAIPYCFVTKERIKEVEDSFNTMREQGSRRKA